MTGVGQKDLWPGAEAFGVYVTQRLVSCLVPVLHLCGLVHPTRPVQVRAGPAPVWAHSCPLLTVLPAGLGTPRMLTWVGFSGPF